MAHRGHTDAKDETTPVSCANTLNRIHGKLAPTQRPIPDHATNTATERECDADAVDGELLDARTQNHMPINLIEHGQNTTGPTWRNKSADEPSLLYRQLTTSDASKS